MKKLSSITQSLEGQKMFQIMERANQLEKTGKRVLHFEIGDPDFSSPEIAKTAAISAISQNMTKYAPSSGIINYKEACQEITLKSRGFRPALNQLLVTPGANIQIYLACACIIDPGDEVIVQDPCFVSYESIIKSLRGKAIRVPLSENNNFEIEPSELLKRVSPRTKAVIINSPHNPTGSVLSESTIKQIYSICEKYDIFVLSDEVYGRMIYEDSPNKFFSPSQIDQCNERTVIIHSLSKTYSMTGWRIGAVTGPSKLISKMAVLFETINSCVPPFIQYAAAELLKNEPNASHLMMREYQKRRNIFMDRITLLDGMLCNRPFGAFYGFVNIKSSGKNSISYANHLLEEFGIATCPGIYFGPSGEGYVRFCFANSIANINSAFDRLDIPKSF